MGLRDAGRYEREILVAFTFKHGDRPLAGYEIQRGVGRGGFGEVYYAISDGGREVALKYLREHPEVELRGVAQCINLKSPHLVSIFDVKQNPEGEYFVIMEYISGPSLRDMLIAESSGLGAQKAAFFIREIAKGLSYLHDRGIVHRDLKPGNIFYDEGYVKICDYGLSKFISLSRHSAQTTSIGTVHYMAPEVGSGNYSKTIDIYALGVVLYEMLLGKVPYEGSSMGEILMKHLTEQPEVGQLPTPFGSVIRKALAKDPAQRYQDVREMVEDIFEVEDVKQSVRGFEATSLTMVAAHVADDIRPSPVPSDNPRATERPRPGARPAKASAEEFSRRFVQRTGGLDPWMTRKEQRQAKREKKRRKRREVSTPELLGTDALEQNVVRSPYRIGFGRRLGRLFAATLVAGGLAFGIGIVSEDPELAGVSFAVIMTSVVGIGLGNKVANWLGPDHPQLISRLLVLAFAAPAAAIVYGAVCDGGVGYGVLGNSHDYLYVPLLGAFAVFNWRERIRSGMRGDLGLWSAFWTGALAYGVTLALTSENNDASTWMGVLVGSVALAVQAFSWAMIRNPLLAAADVALGADDFEGAHRERIENATADGASESSRDAGVSVVGVAIGLGGHGSASGNIPAHHIRSKALRIVAGLLSTCSALGIIALSILLGLGQLGCGDEDLMCAIVGIVAQSLFFLFWLGTVTPFKRVGLWNEWINPLLRIPVGTALATGISGLSLLSLHDGGELAGFIMIVIVSSLAFLALLIFRQSKRKQLRSYRRPRDDHRDPGGGGAGGWQAPGGRSARAHIGEKLSEFALDIGDVFGGEPRAKNPVVPANAVSPIAPRRASVAPWAGVAVVVAIGLAASIALLSGDGRAPTDAGLGSFISVDSDGVEAIATVESPLGHFHVAPRTPGPAYRGIALASGFIVVAALIALVRFRRRDQRPPEFIKRP